MNKPSVIIMSAADIDMCQLLNTTLMHCTDNTAVEMGFNNLGF